MKIQRSCHNFNLISRSTEGMLEFSGQQSVPPRNCLKLAVCGGGPERIIARGSWLQAGQQKGGNCGTQTLTPLNVDSFGVIIFFPIQPRATPAARLCSRVHAGVNKITAWDALHASLSSRRKQPS